MRTRIKTNTVIPTAFHHRDRNPYLEKAQTGTNRNWPHCNLIVVNTLGCEGRCENLSHFHPNISINVVFGHAVLLQWC